MNKEYSRQTSSIILLNVESLFSQQAGNDSFTVNVTITNEVNDTKVKTLVENLISKLMYYYSVKISTYLSYLVYGKLFCNVIYCV